MQYVDSAVRERSRRKHEHLEGCEMSQNEQQNADGSWSPAKPLSYHYHRDTLRMKLGYLIRRLAKRVAGNYWKCSNCGWVDHKEQEVGCWKCKIGEMIYQG